MPMWWPSAGGTASRIMSQTSLNVKKPERVALRRCVRVYARDSIPLRVVSLCVCRVVTPSVVDDGLHLSGYVGPAGVT